MIDDPIATGPLVERSRNVPQMCSTDICSSVSQTSVINAIRAHFAEFGIVAPVGRYGEMTRIISHHLGDAARIVASSLRNDTWHTSIPPRRTGTTGFALA